MNTTGWLTERLLVPRWRSYSTTAAAHELSAATKITRQVTTDEASRRAVRNDVQNRLAIWAGKPDLVRAAEVVDAALTAGCEDLALDAARSVIRDHPTARPMVRRQAEALLRRTGALSDKDPAQGVFEGIREWREALRIYPRNAIGWTELALNQVIANHLDAAERSMRVALALAPHNRHVLRSAARLHLHREDHERAHDLLARNDATKSDPWLIAAEISLARAARRSSRFLKSGEGLLKDLAFSPRNMSELAGAVGTAHMLDGNRKGLRKLFHQSLEDPTANALAQSEWASRAVGEEWVSDERIRAVPEAFEALALHRFREALYSEVPDICLDWAKIDQFSIRPYEFGAVAASLVQDFERAVALADQGLQRRPLAHSLLNSKAFALGSMNKPVEALEVLKNIPPEKADNKNINVRSANLGLCAFRLGNTDEALAHYRSAIEGFTRANAVVESASARAYLAREAAIAGIKEAPRFLQEAEDALRPFKSAEANLVVRRLKGEDVDAQMANAAAAQERARNLQKLRSVTWTVPGLPGHEGIVHRLKVR